MIPTKKKKKKKKKQKKTNKKKKKKKTIPTYSRVMQIASHLKEIFYLPPNSHAANYKVPTRSITLHY